MAGAGSQPTFKRGGVRPSSAQGFTRRGMNALRNSYPRYNTGGGAGASARISNAPVQSVAVGGTLQVTLAWVAPTENGGSAVTNYEVWRGLTAGSETLRATVSNVLTYVDAGEAATQYFYKIKALTAAGASPFSNERNATTDA